MSWAAVVKQIENGNELGVETLCSVVMECARAQLYRMVEPQAVDDCVQEVVLIVLAAVRGGELRNPECFLGFVRTVTRRQVTAHIRRAIVRRRRLTPVEASDLPSGTLGESPEGCLRLQERIDLVKKVLQRLCRRDREILTRFYYDDQNCEHICREMGLTPTQFRLYKSRALAKCSDMRAHAAQPSLQSTRPLRIA